MEVARPVRRCGPGKQTDRKTGTAPRPDPYHIIWWEHGGPTNLDNLVFLCRWHHTRVHAGELQVAMIDRRPQFTNNAGNVLAEPRDGRAPPGDPPEPHAA